MYFHKIKAMILLSLKDENVIVQRKFCLYTSHVQCRLTGVFISFISHWGDDFSMASIDKIFK